MRSGVNHRIRQKLDSRRNYWLYRGICCFSITHETLTVGSKSGKFVREERHVYPCTDCCFSDLALEKSKRVGLVQSSHHLVWYKAVIIWSGTKQSSSHWNVICFLHYIAEKLLTWFKTTITRSLTWSCLQQFPHNEKYKLLSKIWSWFLQHVTFNEWNVVIWIIMYWNFFF
jgi:hypothetical protein